MKAISKLYNLIGINIKYFRKKINMTQEELSKKVDLDRKSITHIEAGAQRVSIERLYRISDALDISIHDILPKSKMFIKELIIYGCLESEK